MSRYQISWVAWEGERICRLRDLETNTEVDVAPHFGMNLIRYSFMGKDVILQPPSMAMLREKPFRYGIPILSPPGLTSYGRFTYRGQCYQLPITVGEHNVHGEIGTLPWQVRDFGIDDLRGAFLQASYSYRNDPQRYAYFPFDLEYNVSYRVGEGKVSLEGTVRNLGNHDAPFSLGYHPYFVCDREHTTLQMPARAQWNLERADAIIQDTPLSAAFRQGMKLAEVTGNLHVFQCAELGSERNTAYPCTLEDTKNNRRIRYHVLEPFSIIVFFEPSWGEAISLEPYSCIPDALNPYMRERETGMLELAPGEARRFGWHIEVDHTLYKKGVD
jgi:aldose 1-epimerase